MKSKRSLRQKNAPKLRQKLGLQYVVTGIALAVLVGIGLFFYLNLGTSKETKAAGADYTSRNNYQDVWSEDNTWTGGTAPATSVPANNTVNIYGIVTLNGSLIVNDKANVVINDTLWITGDLNIIGKGTVTVASTGVLVVEGNANFNDKSQLQNDSRTVVKGDLSVADKSDLSNSSNAFYVFGTVTDTSNKGIDPVQTEQDLANDDVILLEYANGSTPMPVELLYFKAEVGQGQVHLSWATSMENNCDFFTVERAGEDGKFKSVTEIKGAGFSTETVNYNFSDENPVTGTAYYRLKQTDYDGKFAYSDLVSVTYQPQQVPDHHAVTIRTVGPNPFENTFYTEFTLTSAGPVEVRLMDMKRQVAASETIAGFVGNNRYDYSDRQGLITGIYLLSIVQGNTTSKAIRLIKR